MCIRDRLRSVLNNEKAMKSLNWEPEYNLNRGIEELVDWFKVNKDF